MSTCTSLEQYWYRAIPKQFQLDFLIIIEGAQQEKLSPEKDTERVRPLPYSTPQMSNPKRKVNLPAQSTSPSLK